MKIKIIQSNDPYTLDYVKYGQEMVPALTEKNSKFIEAIVRLDSNYSKEADEVRCDDGFDPEKHYKDSEGKYCGSQKYWFKRLIETKQDYEGALLGTIISIDRANSTHLMASEDGRKCMRDRIFKKYDSLESLKDRLKQGFIKNDQDDLVWIMTREINAEGKSGVRYNLSFATKFCSYASMELGCGDLYSKYDSVVSKKLPKYSDIYLGEYKGKGEFKIKSGADLQSRLEVYYNYNTCIGNIMEALKTDGINLTREQIDHIIWYGFKG